MFDVSFADNALGILYAVSELTLKLMRIDDDTNFKNFIQKLEMAIDISSRIL